MKTELCIIAEKWGTDKVPALRCHSYTPYYHMLFKDRRASIKRLLEIGIGWPGNMSHMEKYEIGASLHMWKEYFPQAEIWGLDSHVPTLFEEDRIHTMWCDQGKEECLRYAAEKMGGKFDVIIDDGSHDPKHQVMTATVFVPLLLAPDGTYAIEDLVDPVYVTENLPYVHDLVKFRPMLCSNDMLAVMRGELILA